MQRSTDNRNTGSLLWRVSMKWRAAVDRAVGPLGLTHAQYSLLASLYGLTRTGARPSQRELADFSGLEPIYVSKLARTLEQAGLLARNENPADSRAVQLVLTEHGSDIAVRAIAVVRALQAELTAPIGGPGSSRDRELRHILQTLLDSPPTCGGTNEKRSDAMSPTPTLTPSLTGQNIAEAQGAVEALLERVLVGSGSTPHEFVVMRVLLVRGPYESSDALHEFLAGQRQLGLDRTAIAELLAGLQARGLITGSAMGEPGPAQLTPEGIAMHATLAGTVAPVSGQVFADFAPGDLATARRVLDQVIDQANRLRQDI